MRRTWRRWWEALLALWDRGSATGFPLPAPVLVHEDPLTLDFDTPACGDAFDFKIGVRFDWCSRALAPGARERAEKERELREAIADQRADVEERITNLIRPVARKFSPYAPAELEQCLYDQGVCVDLNEGSIQVHARVRVQPCSEIREAMRPGSLERVRLDSVLRTQEQQITQLRSLRAQWATLLNEALRDMGEIDAAKTGWLAPYPLALAEKPNDAYKFLVEMLNQRYDNSQTLLTRLGDAIAKNHRLDVWDVVVKQNTALRAVLKDLGVPVPPLHDDPLVPDEDRKSADAR